eukprot:47336-Pyramimonas_sp.AAC.1
MLLTVGISFYDAIRRRQSPSVTHCRAQLLNTVPPLRLDWLPTTPSRCCRALLGPPAGVRVRVRVRAA